jgi:hypothetical protein
MDQTGQSIAQTLPQHQRPEEVPGRSEHDVEPAPIPRVEPRVALDSREMIAERSV